MLRTPQEAIDAVCPIISLAWQAIDPNFNSASDCFCNKQSALSISNYRNDEVGINYVRQAVVRCLKIDGYKIPSGFDPETGKELNA